MNAQWTYNDRDFQILEVTLDELTCRQNQSMNNVYFPGTRAVFRLFWFLV